MLEGCVGVGVVLSFLVWILVLLIVFFVSDEILMFEGGSICLVLLVCEEGLVM